MVQFSPRGDLLAVGGRDVGTDQFDDHGDVKLYAASDGKLLNKIECLHRVHRLTFSRNGMWLAVASALSREGKDHRDNLHVFRVSDVASPLKRFDASELPSIRGMLFSQNSEHLAAWGRDGVRVWSTANWQQVLTIPGQPRSVALASSGDLLAVARWEPRVIDVWDVTQRRKVATLQGTEPLALDPSGQCFVYFDPQRHGLIFYRIDERLEESVLGLPGASCHDVAFTDDGTVAAILGCSEDPATRRLVAVVDRREQAIVHRFDRKLQQPGSLAVLGDKYLVVSDEQCPAVFELESGELVGRLSTKPSMQHVTAIGGRLASYGSESVAVWDIENGLPRIVWQDRWRRHPWSPLE